MTEANPPCPRAEADLLAGVRVVELSASVAGADCGKVLAQLGAAVTRCGIDTPVIASPDAAQRMQRVFHEAKTTLDLGDPRLESALAAAHVVIVESLPPGHPLHGLVRAVLDERRGLAAGTNVVALSFDSLEEDCEYPASSLTSVAASGMSFAIGNPGAEPLTLPCDIGDYEAGVNAASAAIAGLLRGADHPGDRVDVSRRDVLANLVGTLALNYVPYGRPWHREGTRPSLSGGVYPCGLFPCKDGYVALYCRGNQEWVGLVKAMDNPPWSGEPRFADARIVATRHADEADAHLMPWLARYTRAELLELGAKFGFPSAPVRYVREALDDAQFAFRGSLVPLSGEGPTVKVPAAPWQLFTSDVAAAEMPDRRPVPKRDAAGTRAVAVRPTAGILAGVRVLDFTWVWSGPMVTSILADLGAEVVKIEHPSRLDSLRQRGAALRDGVAIQGPAIELNPWFNQLNHAKKSVVLDMKASADRETLRELAATCDVVVENMRPGALADAGLDYAALSAVNPGLVMLSMSMAGQTGPLARMKGYAGIMTAMAGLESVVGYESAQRDAPFTGMPMTALGDPNGAAHGIAALLAALHRKRETGRGTWIDLAQTDAILAIMGAPIVESQLHGYAPVRGNTRPDCFPHGHFPSRGRDDWVAIAIQNDAQWAALVRLAAPALDAHAGLSLAARQARSTDITRGLADWTRPQDADAIAARLRAQGIPSAPVASYEAMFASDWKARRRLTRAVRHPWLGLQEVFVPPWFFSAGTPGIEVPAPLLGEHTAEVLRNAASRPSVVTDAAARVTGGTLP